MSIYHGVLGVRSRKRLYAKAGWVVEMALLSAHVGELVDCRCGDGPRSGELRCLSRLYC